MYASGLESYHKRQLSTRHGNICWQYLCDAYHWDKTNFLRINRKLNDDHFFLNYTLKMITFLAEQVLNSDLLLLVRELKKNTSTPFKPSRFRGTLRNYIPVHKFISECNPHSFTHGWKTHSTSRDCQFFSRTGVHSVRVKNQVLKTKWKVTL